MFSLKYYLLLQHNSSSLKRLTIIIIIAFCFSCQQTKQKSLNSICGKMSETTAKCTKVIGTIGVSVVENQLNSQSINSQKSSPSISLIDIQDVFAW